VGLLRNWTTESNPEESSLCQLCGDLPGVPKNQRKPRRNKIAGSHEIEVAISEKCREYESLNWQLQVTENVEPCTLSFFQMGP
jgi:hypothetical protein